MMLYAFTDESYSSRKYFQAAYIVDVEQLLQIEQVMENLFTYARGIGIEGNVEFHGHAIMNAKEDRRRIRFDTLNQSIIFPRIKTINFVESSDYPGIQIADMCIYLYRRLVDHQEVNQRTKYLVDELWKSLAPLVNRQLGH
jgi:hypothetical protein